MTAARRPMTGAEYIESLRDDRAVYIEGERVADVTEHPAFSASIRRIARMYDAVHDPDSGFPAVPTDTGSGGMTHPFFKAARSTDDLIAARDAIAHWARMSYGWMGRTPDYKASFLATLGSNTEFYGEFAPNATRWYRESQERLLYWNHALVNPPIDRHLDPEESSDVVVHVERETDSGVVLSGAKVVATGSAMTHLGFVAHSGAPVKDKRFDIIAAVPMNAPGVKLISRTSYAQMVERTSAVFDYPLSSRFDENDPILVLDQVEVPWENVFHYGANGIGLRGNPSFGLRFPMHGATRLAVKLDFIAGLLAKSLKLTGTSEFRGVQTRLGEVLGLRSMIWSLTEAMVRAPEPGPAGSVDPNLDAVNAYRTVAAQAYARVREIVLQDLGSALIYLPSSVKDFKSPELRGYLDKYVRGSGGVDAEERVKTLKLMWDAVGSEFGGRHELYERNYQGNHELVRLLVVDSMERGGGLDKLTDFVDQAMAEYDLDGEAG
ncbi:MAG TPA: 4-hydroxyphenylacetate 3-hydroxylase N-terminal domain-containing protein [Microbacteriaceae bacterium]|nr:4-hydroxyphenylacetate 3-hydroxylase N-terminal domain-containing protein [Microbacteriaceae bacterium]